MKVGNIYGVRASETLTTRPSYRELNPVATAPGSDKVAPVFCRVEQRAGYRRRRVDSGPGSLVGHRAVPAAGWESEC